MKVVEILAPGFEEIEALTPVDYLRRAGAEVVTLGVNAEGETFSEVITGSHGIKVLCDKSFDDYLNEVKEQLPDCVVIPGGMPGSSNIGKNKKVIEFIKKMNEAKKFVCAICAAPIVVLAQTGILVGKNFTCYPGMEKRIDDFIPVDLELSSSDLLNNSCLKEDAPCVREGNLITGKGPGAADQFSMMIVEALFGQEVMNSVKSSSCQR